MATVAKILYRNPVVFLGVCQVAVAAAIEQDLIGWPGLLAIAAITYLQRELVTPVKGRERRK